MAVVGNSKSPSRIMIFVEANLYNTLLVLFFQHELAQACNSRAVESDETKIHSKISTRSNKELFLAPEIEELNSWALIWRCFP